MAWVLIFVVIIIVDLIEPTSFFATSIKLGSIILCLIYAITTFPGDNLLHLALFITILADVVLALNNTANLGVLLFLIAQIIHTIRLSWSKLSKQIIGFTIIAACCIIITSLFRLAPPIYTICVFYVITLTVNILICWRWRAINLRNPYANFGLFGFLLFLCCDICTGISYLSFNLALPSFLYTPANFFAWFFYYPSQVLISNSSRIASTPKD